MARIYWLPFPGTWQVACDECDLSRLTALADAAEKIKAEHNQLEHGA